MSVNYLRTVLIALALVVVYAGLGFVVAGVKPAMIYLREFASPLLALLVGLDVGRIWGYKTIATCFLFSTALSLGLTLIEISFPIDTMAQLAL